MSSQYDTIAGVEPTPGHRMLAVAAILSVLLTIIATTIVVTILLRTGVIA